MQSPDASFQLVVGDGAHDLPKNTVLPADSELREKLADIVARVCSCERAPLLEDQPFETIITQFDSLAVLEILLEIEAVYGIETDEMLPVDQDAGSQELLSVFPTNLSELARYMREVVAARPQRELERLEREAQAQARQAEIAARRGATAESPQSPDAEPVDALNSTRHEGEKV